VIPHISTGDMFRAAVKSRTPFGMAAKSYMDSGELVPDEIVLGLIRERLEADDTRGRGFVLDGFPRNVMQAEGLGKIIAPGDIDLVVNLVVPTVVALRRLAGRRVCVDCGTNYSTSAPPRINWTCDVCGGEVVQREDDTETAIRRRLDLYEAQTAPLVAWYRRASLLVNVPGTGTADQVTERVVHSIDRRRGEFGVGPAPAI
jgi:adenylate kinase